MANKNVNYEVTATDKFTPAFQKLKSQITSTAAGFAGMQSKILALGVGSVTLAGFGLLVKRMVDVADETGKAAQKAGMATAEFSKMAYAAGLSGVSVEQLTKGAKGLSDMVVKATDATSHQAAVMKALGVDIGGSVNDAMLKVADTFKALPDGATKTALAVQVFGKAGQEMIPMLNQGSAGLRQMQDEAVKFGLVIGEDAAKAAEHLNDNLRTLGMTSDALGIQFVNEFAPGLARVTDAMKEAYLEGGKLKALWIGFGGVMSMIFTDADLTPLQKLNKEIKTLMEEVGRIQAAQAEGPGLIEWIVGNQDQALGTRMNAVTQQLSELRVQRTALLAVDGEAARVAKLWADYNAAEAKTEEERIRKLLGQDAARAKSAAELLRQMNTFNDVMAKASGLAGDYDNKLADLFGLYSKGAIDVEQYREAVTRLINQQPFVTEEQKRLNDAWAAGNKLMDDLKKHYDDAVTSMQAMVADMEFELTLLGKSNTEREIAIKLRDLENKGIRAGSDAYGELAPRIRAAVEGLAAQRESIAFWDQMSNAAGHFFGDLVTNGRSAFDRLRDSLKAFAAELIALFAKKWILNLVGQGSLAATAGQGSLAGSILNGAGILGTAGQGIAGLGGLLGSSTLQGFGAGLAGVPAAAVGESAIAAGVGVQGSAGAAGLGNMLAVAAPYVAIAAALYGLYKAFASPGGGPKTGGSFQGLFDASGALTGTDSAHLFGLQPNESTGNASVQTLALTTAEAYFKLVKQFGGTAQALNFGLGYDSDPAGTAANRIAGRVTDANGRVIFREQDREIGRDNTQIGPELQLTASRALLAALQASDLQADMAKLFAGVAAATADQATLDGLFTAATDLQNVLDLLATTTIPDLTLDGLRGMQTAGESLTQTMLRVSDVFEQAKAAAAAMFSEIQSQVAQVYGGQWGVNFAQAAFDAAANAWNAAGGWNTSAAETLRALRAGENAQAILDISNPNSPSYNATLAALVGPLLSAFTALQGAIAAQTGATNANTAGGSEFVNTMNNFAAQWTDAQGGLAGYLRGLNQSDLSPLDPKARYSEAQRIFNEQLGLAQGGNLEALSGIQGYHQQFLQASRGVNGSNGQFNVDYFGSYNQLAGLTGGQVTPFTNATALTINQQQLQALAEVKAEIRASKEATIALGRFLAEQGLTIRSPQLVEAIEAAAEPVGTGFLSSGKSGGVE